MRCSLQQWLCNKKVTKSFAEARRLVSRGVVKVNDTVVTDASQEIPVIAQVRLKGRNVS